MIKIGTFCESVCFLGKSQEKAYKDLAENQNTLTSEALFSALFNDRMLAHISYE